MNQSAMAANHAANNRVFFAIFIPLLVLFCVIAFGVYIKFACLYVVGKLWHMVDFAFIHHVVGPKIHLLYLAGSQINTLTWPQFIFVMNHTAMILFPFLMVLCVGGITMARFHPANLTRREINIYTLPWIMSKFSPTIIPALCYGDKKSLLLNVDPPEHKRALRPDEFAKINQLIVDKRLNHDKARKAFEKQLGKPLKDASSFAEHEKALVAAFGAQVFLNDRKTAETLLDELNRSCLFKPRKAKSKRGYPECGMANDVFNKVMASKKAKIWLTQHSTTRTALSALHAQDIRLPGARFRWLKGLDRTLWYALSSSDRSKVFVEGAGVISAQQWECLIAKTSQKLNRKITLKNNLMMDAAIAGLEADLISIGLIVKEAELGNKMAGKPVDEEEEWQILKSVPLAQQTEPAKTEKEKTTQKVEQENVNVFAPFRPQ